MQFKLHGAYMPELCVFFFKLRRHDFIVCSFKPDAQQTIKLHFHVIVKLISGDMV